ncbi:GQ67_05306T0 [Komagataella phaffii]|nr:GQ67_05306T0 [Komagataella phaffii]
MFPNIVTCEVCILCRCWGDCFSRTLLCSFIIFILLGRRNSFLYLGRNLVPKHFILHQLIEAGSIFQRLSPFSEAIYLIMWHNFYSFKGCALGTRPDDSKSVVAVSLNIDESEIPSLSLSFETYLAVEVRGGLSSLNLGINAVSNC